MAEYDKDGNEEGYKAPKNHVELAAFLLERLDRWRDHRRANYEPLWDEYERIWRGIWNLADRQRSSERSRFVSPMTAIAIESRRTEIEEAIFGKGLWFDIEDDDQDPVDVAKIKKELMLDFRRDKVKKTVSLCNTNAEVYGTAIAEIVMQEVPMVQPATQGTPVPGVEAVGVNKGTRKSVKPHPVHPRNFIIDPNAQDVEDAMGVCVEEYVPVHTVVEKMASGIYNECPIETSAFRSELEPVTEESPFQEDRVLIQKYFGLVPKELLEPGEEAEYEDLTEKVDEEILGEHEDLASMVEAVVVLCNGHVLQAEANPFMMKDRPIVVYRPEIIPGRFWGRGTVEKGYNSQKGIDGQLRAHLDHTAITAAPMVATDATRMPRNFKFDIVPGRNIPLQGPPQEIMMPINFGQTSPVNMETAAVFERYLAQSTATADSAAMNNVSNGTDPAVVSMMMSGLIRKHKHALLNFQEDFLIPLVQKCAWRYMQFDPDRYPAKDFSFIPVSSMGMMAREYEQQQLLGLLQTLGPQSPIVPLVLEKIIGASNLAEKEELQLLLKESAKPDPQAQQMAQQMEGLKQAILQAELAKVQAEGQRANAEAMLSMAKAQAIPQEVQAKLAAALGTNLPNQGNEQQAFEQRLRLMQEETKRLGIQQKERERLSGENIAKMQTSQKAQSDAMKARLALMNQQNRGPRG